MVRRAAPCGVEWEGIGAVTDTTDGPRVGDTVICHACLAVHVVEVDGVRLLLDLR